MLPTQAFYRIHEAPPQGVPRYEADPKHCLSKFKALAWGPPAMNMHRSRHSIKVDTRLMQAASTLIRYGRPGLHIRLLPKAAIAKLFELSKHFDLHHGGA